MDDLDMKSIAEMSDDDLMNIDDSDFTFTGEPDEKENPQETPENIQPDPGDSDNSNKENEVTPEVKGDSDETIEPQDNAENKDEPETEEQEEVTEEQDYKPSSENTDDEDSQFKDKTLAPLKANGKELKINSVDELRNLASMGANYSLKMQKLKPHLKLLKTLQKHDLLEDDKINHLIALTKGDKGAISKLLADTGIDPDYMELPDSQSDYKPEDHTIPDSELELDDVLEDLKHSEHYAATMDILGNVWDESSRNVIANNPQSIKTIHEHVSNGMYSKIWTEVERQRMLGNLYSKTDLEAYDTIGKFMQEQGAFNPTADSGSDAKRKAQRKAAGSTRNLGKTKAKTKTLNEYDIFNMSDEEIEALSVPGLT